MRVDGEFAMCSAAAWSTLDNKHLFARNFDHTGIAEGSGVMYIPRCTEYISAVGEKKRSSRYSAVGMGICSQNGIYAVYEGVNERGLMGAQLYYRGFAYYPQECGGENIVQPPLLVYHLLAGCSSVDEAEETLRHETELSGKPLFGASAPLHWMFTDSSGKTLIAEPDKDGLRVYTDTAGVMTNSPPYPWHRLNLLNYTGLDNKDSEDTVFGRERTERCFSGSGFSGLPGDWSSPSRFVRLAAMLRYAVKGRDEKQGVAFFLRLMNSVAFPLGVVRVSDSECMTEGAPPFDYTVYTSVMCAESLKYYWNTYEDQSLRCVDMKKLKTEKEVRIYPIAEQL